MTSKSIGRPRLTTGPTGRIKLEPPRSRQSVSARIGAEKQAERRARAWAEAAGGGRVTVYRRRLS